MPQTGQTISAVSKTSADNSMLAMNYAILHTCDHPFCVRLSCRCHRDRILVMEIFQAYRDGIITKEERHDIFRGFMPW